MDRSTPNLLLALGNDILGDDGVGFLAARQLKDEFGGAVHVEESSEAGLALVELMEGFERALLLDAIVTGQCPVGTVLEFGPDDFRRVAAPSPHYAGMPEILELARRLDIPFPRTIRVLALEVENPYELREALTPRVQEALPLFVERARAILEEWRSEVPCTNTP